MTKSSPLTLWFENVDLDDVARVGGKNASLGEMVRHLGKREVRVPPGFATGQGLLAVSGAVAALVFAGKARWSIDMSIGKPRRPPSVYAGDILIWIKRQELSLPYPRFVKHRRERCI